MSQWNKNRLWDYLVGERLLRAIVVVAGAGPHATGMPELMFNATSPPELGSTCVLATDGRVSFQHEGVSIAHIVPEALDGGGLAAIRTGDWIYTDMARGELHLVAQSQNGRHPYKILSTKDLLNRPDRKKRISELEKYRSELLPSFRTLLDQVSSAEAGVSPAIKPS
jgi:dihydroxyacid dehydratase/phosphogluconate dehydratase